MEAIKKKMQAMKVEKDNLMDRCDTCEQVFKRKNGFDFHKQINHVLLQACRDAKVRQEKTEEEVNELNNKSKTLEVMESIYIRRSMHF